MRIFLSTADASGDLHAAALVRALRTKRPDLDVYGLGGEELDREGFATIVDQSEVAVGGLVEVVSAAPRALRAYTRLRRALVHPRPDLALFVDTPDLNLPLARVAKRAGIRVLYYVAPQVWAWRWGRVRKLRERVDRLGVLFPFEEKLFRAEGIDTTFLGHPLVDRFASRRDELAPERAAASVGLDPARPTLGLLPGSRRNEVELNLAPMLETARIVRDAVPELQVVLPIASTLKRDPPQLPEFVRPILGKTHEAMAAATCLLCAPGTATLEAALLEVPTVITHRAHPLSVAIAQRLVRVPTAGMLNLIAQAGVMPERIQAHARPAALAALLLRWIRRPDAREAARKDLAAAGALLGQPGAVERAARWVLESAPRP